MLQSALYPQKYKLSLNQSKKGELFSMYVHKIKDVVTRSGAFALAVSMVSVLGISAFPALTYADALNPLTERTLLMTSSAPGFRNTDGSGNATYAPPGSGPNGQKAGHKFSFKVSTDSTGSGPAVEGFSFQYCTGAAGDCAAPGDNAITNQGADNANGGLGANADTRPDTASTSDLNINYPSPAEVSTLPTPNANGAALVDRDNSDGNFAVAYDSDANGSADTLDTGWTMVVDNYETAAGLPVGVTAKNNFIKLYKSGGTPLKPAPGTKVEVIFYATDTNFITNPGSDNFFVRLNTYKTADPDEMLPDEAQYILIWCHGCKRHD